MALLMFVGFGIFGQSEAIAFGFLGGSAIGAATMTAEQRQDGRIALASLALGGLMVALAPSLSWWLLVAAPAFPLMTSLGLAVRRGRIDFRRMRTKAPKYVLIVGGLAFVVAVLAAGGEQAAPAARAVILLGILIVGIMGRQDR